MKFSVRRPAQLVAATVVLALATLGLHADALDTSTSPLPPLPSMNAPKTGIVDTLRLRLHHLHTGESIDVAYKQNGRYLTSGVGMLNHFLRDHRTNDTANYDPTEFDLLHNLLAKLHRPNAVIDIVCGYRTPWSNNFLRTRSAETGVAEHSQHILSKAIDIRIPGVSTLALRNAALSLGMGGVGYYPRSGFVHVDVGPVREWQFGGRPPRQFAGVRRSHHGRHRA